MALETSCIFSARISRLEPLNLSSRVELWEVSGPPGPSHLSECMVPRAVITGSTIHYSSRRMQAVLARVCRYPQCRRAHAGQFVVVLPWKVAGGVLPEQCQPAPIVSALSSTTAHGARGGRGGSGSA